VLRFRKLRFLARPRFASQRVQLTTMHETRRERTSVGNLRNYHALSGTTFVVLWAPIQVSERLDTRTRDNNITRLRREARFLEESGSSMQKAACSSTAKASSFRRRYSSFHGQRAVLRSALRPNHDPPTSPSHRYDRRQFRCNAQDVHSQKALRGCKKKLEQVHQDMISVAALCLPKGRQGVAPRMRAGEAYQTRRAEPAADCRHTEKHDSAPHRVCQARTKHPNGRI
jgi:hypothetical protein